ncbi:Putative transposase [Methylocystis sp. SC2]|nr:Putative transposase [Methylocystis sp. SC2]
MAEGTCKLTGAKGRFVKSHLIPKALTRPEEPGLPLIQEGRGERPIRRWDSWYDDKLVTRSGEEILTDLDTWAIATLRQRKLLWSGWGPMQVLATNDHKRLPNGMWGLREVKGIDATRARLFFLSLLWRAAATTRPEFSEVTLPSEDLELLCKLLVEGKPGQLAFYPAILTQLSTLGPTHNHSPIAQTKIIPTLGTHSENCIPIFRFYFDGLIVHVHRHSTDDGYTEKLGPSIVGADRLLHVSTVTYEASFQRENLHYIQAATIARWQDTLRRI